MFIDMKEIIFYLIYIFILFLLARFGIIGKLRKFSADFINFAENFDICGQDKMKIAIEKSIQNIPILFRFFVRKNKIKDIIQETFDKMEEYSEKQKQKGGEDGGS